MSKGVMIASHRLSSEHKFIIRNSDTTSRQVIVEYPVRPGWTLVQDVKPEEASLSFYRFRVPVEPGKSADLRIEEFSTQDVRFELTNLEDDSLKYLTDLFAYNRITPALKDALQRILQKKDEIAALERQSGDKKRLMDAIEKDQSRLRENMKALKGGAEERALTERYTRELNNQEDQMSVLSKEKEDLDAKQEQAEKEFDQMVQQIAVDERF
jgi:hypothetical protein